MLTSFVDMFVVTGSAPICVAHRPYKFCWHVCRHWIRPYLCCSSCLQVLLTCLPSLDPPLFVLLIVLTSFVDMFAVTGSAPYLWCSSCLQVLLTWLLSLDPPPICDAHRAYKFCLHDCCHWIRPLFVMLIVLTSFVDMFAVTGSAPYLWCSSCLQVLLTWLSPLDPPLFVLLIVLTSFVDIFAVTGSAPYLWCSSCLQVLFTWLSPLDPPPICVSHRAYKFCWHFCCHWIRPYLCCSSCLQVLLTCLLSLDPPPMFVLLIVLTSFVDMSVVTPSGYKHVWHGLRILYVSYISY